MEIVIKEVEPCKLSIHYVAGAEEILNKSGVVIETFKKAPVPGFRPGKATVEAIRMHYRDQIEESLKRALMEDAYHNTLFEKKLRPHGAPRFNGALLADGKFTVDFDLFIKPEFELALYKDLEVPNPAEPHTAEEVTELMMQDLRVRFGDVTPYTETDFVQVGDNVIVDYEGSVDGAKVDAISTTGDMLTVGKSMLPAFDDNLLGMIIGDTREFDMTVPLNGLPSMAGKTVHIKVTLNMGSKTVPCVLDDTLATKVGKKDMSDLRTFVAGTAVARTAQAHRMRITEAIASRLIADNKVNVPGWLALSEAQYLVHQAKLEWNTMADTDREKYLELGEKNVKLALILDKIREAEAAAQLSDQEVFDIIKRNLANTKVNAPIDDVIKEMNRTGYLQILFSRVRDEHALDFVVKQSKLID